MSNPEHLAILKQGVNPWNKWRHNNNESVVPDLSHADLRGANLSEAYLLGADLREANLRGVNLCRADLSLADLREANLSEADLGSANLGSAHLTEADLTGADLHDAYLGGTELIRANLFRAGLREADLGGADLSLADLRGAILTGAKLRQATLRGADLRGADLTEADLYGADLTEANLREANLSSAVLVDTRFDRADLTGASIFGISAWNLSLEGAVQQNLLIQPSCADAPITVDDLEVAQFIYLLLNNTRLRHVIDTITTKLVLILGRFTPERKAILDALRDELRRRNYIPILFDFEKPSHRDLTETISTLAHMARFVIADLTDARSLPQELTRIVPILPSVPVQPILLASNLEWAMYNDLTSYPWVLPTLRYENEESLLAGLQAQIIDPSEQKANEQMERYKGIKTPEI